MDIKRDLKYREQIKADIAKHTLDMEANTREQKLEKYDLGLRVLKFLQFEQDEEFEKWFNDFYRRRTKEDKEIGDR